MVKLIFQDARLIESMTGTLVNSSTQLRMSPFHTPAYSNDILKTRFLFFVTLLIQFTYVFTLIVNIGNIVLEKQTKMKEYLKLLGVKWYVIW